MKRPERRDQLRWIPWTLTKCTSAPRPRKLDHQIGENAAEHPAIIGHSQGVAHLHALAPIVKNKPEQRDGDGDLENRNEDLFHAKEAFFALQHPHLVIS